MKPKGKKYYSISLSVTQEEMNYLQTQPNASVLIRSLIDKHIGNSIEEPVPDEPFLDLLTIREGWVKRLHQDPNYLDEFESLEHYLLRDTMTGGYDIDELKVKWLNSVPEHLKTLMWNEYFISLDKLDDEYRPAFYNAIQKDAIRQACGKDAPDKVIYGKFTAEDLMREFDKNATYTTMSVAAKLGINYQQAYRHITPWLISHGFTIKTAPSTQNNLHA